MESFRDILWVQLKALRPSFSTKRPHFNFITAHYLWIVGLTIAGSVLIYGPGRGNLKYIDALVFAAGSSTQAGLNTVDVNKLNTAQQIMIYVLCSLSNPITINSFVVLLRLFWFEKRFQHVVHEARLRRGTISRSKAKAADGASRLEMGVNGRHITVMHNGTKGRVANDGTYLGPLAAAASEGKPPRTSMIATAGAKASSPDRGNFAPPTFSFTEPLETRIKFAPTVKRSDGLGDDSVKLPPQVPSGESAAVETEGGPGPEDDEVLRIPGPRDAERGILPRRVEEGESEHEGDEDDDEGDEEATPDRPINSSHGPDDQSEVGTPSVENNPNQVEDNNSIRSNGEAHGAPGTNGAADGRGRIRLRQGITIEEPVDLPSRRDELSEDARAVVNVVTSFTSFRLRRPHGSGANRQKRKQQQGDKDDPKSRPAGYSRVSRRPTLQNLRTAFTRDKSGDPAPYLSWEPTLGRNSAFINLSEEQREELGGIEYRSLKTLAIVLFFYFWGFWLFGLLCLLPWILKSERYGAVVDSIHQSRAWWGFFTSHSAFMDLGFTLTPDSMNQFNTAVFPLLVMSFLIVSGNTGFPAMLRFVIWVASLVVPRGSGVFEELKFLLDHPRRCFTLLFPSGATWWLFWLLVILNGIDLLFFCILDLGNGPIFALPAGIRVLDGLFQAFSTRTAGFACVNLADVHPAVQASYMIMMYISVFPIAISVRRTNVYEEKSLGVYTDIDEPANGTDMEYVGAHLRRQLSFDLWFLSIGFFILTISEGGKLQRGEFSMFAVLFEVISAYGTVGLSLGFSDVNASLCSQFTVVGKLVIIAMMIRGRHRGLPYGLDKAILLPRELDSSKAAAVVDANAPTLLRSMTGRGSMVSLRAQQSAVRGTSTNRERRRSRSVDRVHSALFTQFLHPGPPVVHTGAPHRSHTEPVSESTDSRAQASGFNQGDTADQEPYR